MKDAEARAIIDAIDDIAEDVGLPHDTPVDEVMRKFFAKYKAEPSEVMRRFIANRDDYMRRSVIASCQHEFVSMRNKVIKDGEFCPKCGAIRR